MASTESGPFLPLGYDIGFESLLDPTGQSLPLQFDDLEAMTQLHYEEIQENLMFWTAQSPNDTHSSRSDAARSPGKQSLQATAASGSRGSLSLSPAGDALIYTPASTLLDFQDDTPIDDPESEDVSTSPNSSNHTDDFVHVGRIDSDYSEHGRRMNLRPPPQSGVSPSTQPSLPSRESSVSHSVQATRPQQWNSFASSSSAGMDDHFIPFTSSADLGFPAGTFADEDLLSVGDLDSSFQGQTYDNIPFRTFNDGSVQLPTSFADTSMLSQPSVNPRQNMPTSHPNQRLNQQFNPFGQVPSQQMYSSGFNAHDFAYQGHQINTRPAQPVQTNMRSPHGMSRPQPQHAPMLTTQNLTANAPLRRQHHPHLQQAQLGALPQAEMKPVPSNNRSPTQGTSSFTARSAQPYPSIVKREPSQSSSSTGPVRSSQADRAKRGGRSRNSHLTEQTRQKSHAMRKVGACWRCAMQRDPCDDGNPCSRCLMRSQRGQTYYFDCDRSKLPDFVHDFLPPQASMTLMHQKQSIEDTVSKEVVRWDHDNGLDVYLSSGYGPPLRWKLFEFTPRTDELLSQLQYKQNPLTGRQEVRKKFSPPFGLLKIDTSDDAHFDAYLDQLLDPRHLIGFGWTCYEEESQVDPDMFQAQLLDLMCGLYVNTGDANLRSLLRDVLRMMIITFIMGHTLTIVEETLPTVLSHVRNSARPDMYEKHTSPRLANRQLKFFFAIMRNHHYEKILKWQQSTLHTAGKKDSTWLHSFCVMLGFAMVLEEVQRTMQIQADAAERKNEMGREDAQQQARNACERIDERFNLLIGLFQCKYRDRKWGENGSFGNQTPELKEPAQKEFLRALRVLLVNRYAHLKSRENVPFSSEMQCLYTTRLTARFLLPFLKLPTS